MKAILITLGIVAVFFFIIVSALIVAIIKHIHDNNIESQE